MNKFLSIFKAIIDTIAAIMKWVGVFLIIAIVVSITLQVFSRYILGRPHLWVEEFATYSFIWTVYVGAAYALIKKRHIIVTTVIDFLSPRWKLVLAIFANCVMLFFLFYAVRFGYRQFLVEAPQSTIALPIKLPRRLFYSLPFIISTASMFITTIFHLIQNMLAVNKLRKKEKPL